MDAVDWEEMDGNWIIVEDDKNIKSARSKKNRKKTNNKKRLMVQKDIEPVTKQAAPEAIRTLRG